MEINKTDIQEPESEIEHLVRARYGKYSYIQNLEENEGVYDIHIGFRIPRSFDDRRLGKIFYKHLELDDLAIATGYYNVENSDELRLEMPEKEEISKRIKEEINSIKRNIEVELVAQVGHKLAKLPGVQNEFSKVRRILRLLRTKNKTDFSEMLENEGNLSSYLDLLTSLEYLEQDEGLYVEGDKLKQLYEDEANEAYNYVIRDIIVEKIDHLKEMNLTNVMPYIRILETYYFVAMNTRGDFEITVPQLMRQYKRQHNMSISEAEVIDKLISLEDVGILERQNEFFKGKRDISERILEDSPIEA